MERKPHLTRSQGLFLESLIKENRNFAVIQRLMLETKKIVERKSKGMRLFSKFVAFQCKHKLKKK